MPAKPTNLLVILAGQLRRDDLSCSGYPRRHTPNIDRIAGTGVRVTNASVRSLFRGATITAPGPGP